MNDAYFTGQRIEFSSGTLFPLTIEPADNYFLMHSPDTRPRFYNFFDLEGMAEDVLRSKMEIPREKNANPKKKKTIKKFLSDERKKLAAEIHPYWKEMLRGIPRVKREVHKSFFRHTKFGHPWMGEGPVPPLIYFNSFYSNEYLVGDVIKYGAACIALNNLYHLLERHEYNTGKYFSMKEEIKKAIRHFEFNDEGESAYTNTKEFLNHYSRSGLNKGLMEYANNWMQLYSASGKSYKSLNKTLMNLPGQLPQSLVCRLSEEKIERPLTERLEYLVYMLGTDSYHNKVFYFSDKDRIRKALEIYSAHLDSKKSYRTIYLSNFIAFLNDCDMKHNGNIVGLTEKAIKWHAEKRIEKKSKNCAWTGKLKTKRPPIRLPEAKGVRFLATAEEILNEAKNMHHCVDTYVDMALKGDCFLFHVDYRRKRATAEVGADGRIRMAAGPYNELNVAVDYARMVLERWGDKFPLHHKKRYAFRGDEPF